MAALGGIAGTSVRHLHDVVMVSRAWVRPSSLKLVPGRVPWLPGSLEEHA
jgi:hypothetical protein